jgi:quercetin dioxygenase-like cupin family protein
MKHVNYLDIPSEDFAEAGAHGISIRWLISKKDGAPNFAMRLLTFESGARSPHHSHSWEHEVFVLKGNGSVGVDEKILPLKTGDVVYIPPNVHHHLETNEFMEIL